MPFQEQGSLRYFTFESLAGEALVQAVFTRRGGTSAAPWDSLNLGGTVGDTQQHVRDNRQRAFHALGLPVESLFDVWQVHSAVVIRADQPRPLDEPHRQADAIITDQPGVTLFMRFADCVPIFLFDPRHRAIGLVHAGWKGVLNQVARRAVEAMQAEYHSNPSEIIAAVGPSIGVHHYEVGPELAEQVRQVFTTEADGLLQASNNGGGGVKFDLWNANRLVLESAGVRQVEIAGICTACNPQDWYSHRGEHGKTGRFGAMLALKD